MAYTEGFNKKYCPLSFIPGAAGAKNLSPLQYPLKPVRAIRESPLRSCIYKGSLFF